MYKKQNCNTNITISLIYQCIRIKSAILTIIPGERGGTCKSDCNGTYKAGLIVCVVARRALKSSSPLSCYRQKTNSFLVLWYKYMFYHRLSISLTSQQLVWEKTKISTSGWKVQNCHRLLAIAPSGSTIMSTGICTLCEMKEDAKGSKKQTT